MEGNTTVYLPTMTGAVLSQEPYMMVTLTATLLKPQSLADAYKQQMEANSALGQGTVYPDEVGGLGVYQLYNASISGVRELNFSGEDAGFVLSFRSYYLTNADLFN